MMLVREVLKSAHRKVAKFLKKKRGSEKSKHQ